MAIHITYMPTYLCVLYRPVDKHTYIFRLIWTTQFWVKLRNSTRRFGNSDVAQIGGNYDAAQIYTLYIYIFVGGVFNSNIV